MYIITEKYSGLNSNFKCTIRYIFVVAFVFLYTISNGQITGYVHDDLGDPLTGVTISVLSSDRETLSDYDGNFAIDAKIGDRLKFSYVGYSERVILLKSNDRIYIELKEGFTLEDVVITARRKSEEVHDAPISITAIKGKDLGHIGVNSLKDVGNLVPNLTFTTTGTVSGSSSVAVVYMRGVGQADYVPVADPGVGIYVDDIYLGRTIGSVTDLVDLNRVEVIRGPQGTLFGRNTIGGAIVLTSNDPSDKFEGSISATTGSYTRNDLSLKLSGPIADGIGLSFNGLRKNRNGYVERVNVPGSRNLGDDNVHGGKLMLNIAKDESPFSLKIIVDYINEREESAAEQNLYFHHDKFIPQAWNKGEGVSTATDYDPNDPLSGVNTFNESLNLGPFKTGETSLSQNDIDVYGISANAGYDLGQGYAAKLILAYRAFKAKFARQVDGSSLHVFENSDIYDQNQSSVDLRINKSTDKLDLVTGIFYFNENVDDALRISGVYDGVFWPLWFGGKVKNSNVAGYGEGSYKITDNLSASLGLRYTTEVKKARPDVVRGLDLSSEDPKPTGIPAERNPDKTLVESTDENGNVVMVDVIDNPDRLIDQIWQKNAFSQLTWRANLDYNVNEFLNTYISVSKGFKSGGYEWRVTNASFYDDVNNDYDGDGDGDLPQFKPESVISYEIGGKWDAPDSDFRLNGAAYYSDYTDMQIAANPVGALATFQTNAGDSRIFGFELESIYLLTSQLKISAGYGYTNAKYTDLIEGLALSKNENFIHTPKHMFTFGGSYHFETDYGKFITRVDGHYKSRVDFEAQNSEYTFDDGHTAINASLRYQRSSNLSATLGIDNVTNAVYLIGGDSNSVIGYENGIYARPRNYYLTIDYNF